MGEEASAWSKRAISILLFPGDPRCRCIAFLPVRSRFCLYRDSKNAHQARAVVSVRVETMCCVDSGSGQNDSVWEAWRNPPITAVGGWSLFCVVLQKGHQRWVWDAVFSADSCYLISASSDSTAKLWDVSFWFFRLIRFLGRFVFFGGGMRCGRTLSSIDPWPASSTATVLSEQYCPPSCLSVCDAKIRFVCWRRGTLKLFSVT